jgi:hypothetical protein
MVYLAGFLSRRELGRVGVLCLWSEVGLLRSEGF